MQKLVRAAFGNNNVDTCARVCHSPTGYGLGQTYGTSAGTQTFASVDKADVIMVIGANPTDAHPVFASRMKKRLREGAKLIVVDPRRSTSSAARTSRPTITCTLRPGTNVAVITALAHVDRHRRAARRGSTSPSAATTKSFERMASRSSRRPENSPEAFEAVTGVPAADRARRGAAVRGRSATRRSTTASA